MPTSPLRNEVRALSFVDVDAGRNVLPPIPPMDSPTNWFPQSALPSPTTAFHVTRKPLPESRLPTSNYATNDTATPFLRNQSFSSECSDTPSMVRDYGSDSSEVDRDEDRYHERVAQEWDAYHFDFQLQSPSHFLDIFYPTPTPCSSPTALQPPSQSQQDQDQLFISRMQDAPVPVSFSDPWASHRQKQHRLHKSESTSSMQTLQTARPRASTVTSSSSVSKTRPTSTSRSPLPPPPSRPAPMPTQLQNPMQKQNSTCHPSRMPPPVPPKSSAQQFHAKSLYTPVIPTRPHRPSPADLETLKPVTAAATGTKQHHTFPRRTQPTPLSLYPSTAPTNTKAEHPPRPRPRHTKSTPLLRPEPCQASPFPPGHVANFVTPTFGAGHSVNASAPLGPLRLPVGWPVNSSRVNMVRLQSPEKSVFEYDDEEGGDEAEEGLLAGVAKKVRGVGVHGRRESGGGSGSGNGNGRRSSGEKDICGEEEGRGKGMRRSGNGGSKLRRSAGEMVRGLFRK